METQQTFRGFLQSELMRRCKANPGYSLRAFSRYLKINPSSLSRILRGERPISSKMKGRLGARLGLNDLELGNFSIDPEDQKSFIETGTEKNFHQISLDSYAVISDWYHYAILELTQIREFQSEPQWIASALGITVSEVHIAIERLERLGMLRKDDRGQYVNAVGDQTNVLDQPQKQSAHSELQRQILQQAIRAIDVTPIDKRDQSSMTMAISLKRLAEAEKMITRFRRELCQFLEQDPERDEVYQLSISLFPVTHTQVE